MDGSVRKLGLSQDAAIVLALADTAVPFAHSPEDEAERWVRVLRLHGWVGAALQSLGVGEGPLESPSDEPPVAHPAEERRSTEETVELVCRRALDLARRSGAECVGTVHVLCAVMQLYGPAFDHELYRRGTSRDEIFARLPTMPAPGARLH